MTKLRYNKDVLATVVKPNLQSAITNIQNAINVSQISIPNDFSQYNYLVNLHSLLVTKKNELTNCESWLNQSMSDTDQTLEELESQTKALEEIKIIEKNNSVIIL